MSPILSVGCVINSFDAKDFAFARDRRKSEKFKMLLYTCRDLQNVQFLNVFERKWHHLYYFTFSLRFNSETKPFCGCARVQRDSMLFSLSAYTCRKRTVCFGTSERKYKNRSCEGTHKSIRSDRSQHKFSMRSCQHTNEKQCENYSTTILFIFFFIYFPSLNTCYF